MRGQLLALALLSIAGFCPALAAQAPEQGGSYFALVIGINRYQLPLPALQTAVNDAQAMAKVLSEQYGFQVKLLLDDDATRDNILSAMDQYRRSLHDKDSLLVYYAGHGYADKEEDKAYWIPVDAERNTRSRWIIADELTTRMRSDPARHVLVISDSCYSGGLLREGGTDIRPADQQTYLDKMLAGRSRTLMASGGNEPVTDVGRDGHSVFANAVLRALQSTNVREFTAEEMFHNFVLRQVAGGAEQIPKYSSIRSSGDESGDFVFWRRTDAGVASATTTVLPLTIQPTTDSLNPGEHLRIPSAKRASVYIINHTQINASILCDQKPIALKLEKLRWFTFDLTPGMHTLDLDKTPGTFTIGLHRSSYQINAMEGQDIFLEINVRAEGMHGFLSPRPLDAEKGSKQITILREEEPKNLVAYPPQ